MNKKDILENMRDMTLTYVVDEPSVYNKEGGKVLAICRIVAQNDFIELDVDNLADEAVLTSQDLRNFAEQLNRWADLSDETLRYEEEE